MRHSLRHSIQPLIVFAALAASLSPLQAQPESSPSRAPEAPTRMVVFETFMRPG